MTPEEKLRVEIQKEIKKAITRHLVQHVIVNDTRDLIDILCEEACDNIFLKLGPTKQQEVTDQEIEEEALKQFPAISKEAGFMRLGYRACMRKMRDRLAPKSEAVEFANWIVKQDWTEVRYQSYKDDGTPICKTTEELYQLFKTERK